MEIKWQEAIINAQEKHGLIGLGGAIMRDGEIVALAVAGKRIKARPAEIKPGDLWHIGSITKSMTATMIARLVEQGVMDWDMRIADVFFDMAINAGWDNVTLTHLLTHTSGAPANFPISVMLKWPEREEDLIAARRNAIAAILAAPPKSQAGEKFLYSNVGYTIAGHMAEQATGKSWETLMRAEVFVPLGLSSAGFGPPKPKDKQPWGHKKLLGVWLKSFNPDDNPDNTPIIGPAGTVHMSLADLALYGQVHLYGENGKGNYLKSETFKLLHKATKNEYGFGWVVNEHRSWAKGRAIWHNGSNTMWYALLMLAPETNTVMVFTFNDGRIQKGDAAVSDILKTIQILP